jgi:copper chaperone
MSEQKTDTLQITGMSCGHCVRTVQEALEDVEGAEVLGVEVGSARVRYDPARVRRERLVEAVEGAGFGVQEAA